MNRIDDTTDKTGRFSRRQILTLGAAGLAGLIASPIQALAAPLQHDLALVADIAGMAERETPLLIFRDFVADPDVEVEKQIRDQLLQRPDVLSRIRKKRGFESKVRLSIEEIEVRLMFVPQLEKRHAVAYHRYCTDITDYLFEINQADNIYAAITAPRESYPRIPENGISAFLVHRLAKAYQAVCRFTNDAGKSLKYRVSGAIFSNHLGAVDLEIEWVAPGRFALRRRPFTIWQNNSDEVFNLMAIPVEETLHYYLGTATDRQIAETLKARPGMHLAAARQLADEWMAVEESVVGGLVDRVLDDYCTKYGLPLPEMLPGAGHTALPALSQYRYRKKGIALVRKLGFAQTVAMYMERPVAFKARLDVSHGA